MWLDKLLQRPRSTQKSKFEAGEEKSEASDTVALGRVIRTDPEAGSGRKEGTKVNLIVSSGKQSFQLSNYVGRSIRKL